MAFVDKGMSVLVKMLVLVQPITSGSLRHSRNFIALRPISGTYPIEELFTVMESIPNTTS